MSAPYHRIILNQISYQIADRQQPLFDNLSLTLLSEKTGLVGKNGIGKTTLLRLIMRDVQPTSGFVNIAGKLAYCPQQFECPESCSVSDLLGVSDKLFALAQIESGVYDACYYETLDDDWNLRDNIQQQLKRFRLEHFALDRPANILSGGEQTRLMLARIFLSSSDFIILDEPTNNLDYAARWQLYTAIDEWKKGLLVVSHDRELLNRLEQIVELDERGCHLYGGNYDAYQMQKKLEIEVANRQFHDAKKDLSCARKSQQSTAEKHEHRKGLIRRAYYAGKIPKIGYDALRERGAKTQKRLRIRNKIMTEKAEQKLKIARENILPDYCIQIDLPHTVLPAQKCVIRVSELNFRYDVASAPVIENFSWLVQGPKRVALSGENGSGKTTLVKLLLGEYFPDSGEVKINVKCVRYLDQHIRLLNPELSILDNFMHCNQTVAEVVVRRDLARFLFRNESALKLVKNLSMGEKLRATLACVFLANNPPQLLILDEPTNHLDFESMRSLESALNCYQGALVVISHDREFLKNIGITEYLEAPFSGR